MKKKGICGRGNELHYTQYHRRTPVFSVRNHATSKPRKYVTTGRATLAILSQGRPNPAKRNLTELGNLHLPKAASAHQKNSYAPQDSALRSEPTFSQVSTVRMTDASRIFDDSGTSTINAPSTKNLKNSAPSAWISFDHPHNHPLRLSACIQFVINQSNHLPGTA